MPSTRKRKASNQDQPSKSPKSNSRTSKPKAKSEEDSASKPSIVGGPNGDYRITGTELPSGSSPYKTFTIPTSNDKVIPCQLHGPAPESSSPSAKKSLLIFTHGAGGGIENPATKLFVEGYASADMPVLCFQGTMNLTNRVKSFETVLEYCREEYSGCEFMVGGRSMGARAAVVVAGAHDDVIMVVAVSYPLVSGKGEVRDQILLDLDERKSVYFVSGDGDDMCELGKLADVRREMVAGSRLVVVEGADHGMSLGGKVKEKGRAVEEIRKASGHFVATSTNHDNDGNDAEDDFRLRWNGELGKTETDQKADCDNSISKERDTPKQSKTSKRSGGSKGTEHNVVGKKIARKSQGSSKGQQAEEPNTQQKSVPRAKRRGSNAEDQDSPGLRRSKRKKT